LLQDRRRKADRPLIEMNRTDEEQEVWAALGYICPPYARYVETSGKGPGVVDRGVCRLRMGGSDGMTVTADEEDRGKREERVSRTVCIWSVHTDMRRETE
jgi:hypothetical protein